MATAIRRNFETPDETRQIVDGLIEVVNLGDVTSMRATFNPGWKWSTSVKPVVGTDSCQVNHISYQISGRLRVRLDDGSETEYGPGDAYNIPPGHDAWVIGDEAVVSVDFRGGDTYAKPQK